MFPVEDGALVDALDHVAVAALGGCRPLVALVGAEACLPVRVLLVQLGKPSRQDGSVVRR